MIKKVFILALLLPSIHAFSQGSNGLVAHWNFNGSINDIGPNTLQTTDLGTTATAGFNNIANTGRLFNGSTYIDVPFDPVMNMDSISICALVKPTGYYPGTCQVNSILCRGTQAQSGFYRLDYNDNSYDNDCATTSDAHQHIHSTVGDYNEITPAEFLTTSNVVLNTWYCIVTTFDTDSMKIYIDGNLVLSADYANTPIGVSTQGINIGAALVTSPNFPYYFTGIIDDIKIYKRALNASEADMYCDSTKMTTSVAQSSMRTNRVSVSPNPATNIVNISLDNISANGTIAIVNMLGQTILSVPAEKQKTEIDVRSLPAGTYFIKIQANDELYSERFVKQ